MAQGISVGMPGRAKVSDRGTRPGSRTLERIGDDHSITLVRVAEWQTR